MVYCINLSKHVPVRGVELDVLGPASSLPGPGGAQLQAVLERIASLPRAPGGTGERAGGQNAVWAVTDLAETSDRGRRSWPPSGSRRRAGPRCRRS